MERHEQRMEHDDVHELAAGYVLGALEEHERRTFESHLGRCSACRVQVASLGDAATALAYATEGAEPPMALRERVLQAARREQGAAVIPFRQRLRARPVWAAASAAAAAVAIGVGAWAMLDAGGSPAARAQKLALQGRVGTLTVSGSGHAVLAVQNLAPPPLGHVYEIWVIADGKPSPDSVFRRGGVLVTVPLVRRVRPGQTVAVTVESHLVTTPTTVPFAQASLPA